VSLSPHRAGRLTASVFAAAIGLNPYMTRQKLYRELTGIDERFMGNEATQWGIDHEQDAVDQYEAEFGVILDKSGADQQFIICSDNGWMGCTPDGFHNDTLIEIKCPHSLNLYPDVPAHYMPQVQGQMAIANKHECHFICWTPDDFAVWEVEFHREYWEQELELLAKFYEQWKADEQPPRSSKPVMPDVKTNRIY